MRLSRKEIETILKVANEIYGKGVKVYLFGSRTDDNKRGGDIDLLLRTPQSNGGILKRIRMAARLKELLAPVKDEFDFIFIDCPPSLGLLTINALAAADSVLIPIQCEYYALEGVTKLLESMRMVKSRINKDLDTYGVLMTMYDSRTSLSNQVVDEVRNYFGDKTFKTLIPRTVKLSEAPSFGMPVINYAPNNKGAKAYRELAKEVIRRA